MGAYLQLLILSTCAVVMVTSFPNGPPIYNYTCKEMFPLGHGVDAQYSNPPFEIKLSQNIYTPWEKVNVTLSAGKGRKFRGFFLQARLANCASSLRQTGLGIFQPETVAVKPMDCLGGNKNAVSHADGEEKSAISVMWNAPGKGIGHIYFVATVVEKKTTFWTNVYSDILRLAKSSAGASICESRMKVDPYEGSTTQNPSTGEQKSGSGSETLSISLLILMVLTRVNVFGDIATW